MQKIVAKIVLIGSIGVGKTSLIRQFVHQKFSDEYMSTIGVKVDKKSVQLENTQVDLLIWDLAGEIYLSNLFAKYLKGAAGVIGVFDITRPSTHDKLLDVFNEISSEMSDINKIILGNKADLSEDEEYKQHIRDNYTYHLLTSAKNGQNVQQAFIDLARLIITSK